MKYFFFFLCTATDAGFNEINLTDLCHTKDKLVAFFLLLKTTHILLNTYHDIFPLIRSLDCYRYWRTFNKTISPVTNARILVCRLEISNVSDAKKLSVPLQEISVARWIYKTVWLKLPHTSNFFSFFSVLLLTLDLTKLIWRTFVTPNTSW